MKKILFTLCLCSGGFLLFGQNSFKVLVDWDDDAISVIGLKAQEDADGNFIILSNNQHFEADINGVPIEGDMTLGSELTKISANGEILWKKSYSTNQYPIITSGDLNLLGRTPAPHFILNTQQEILLPFSRYTGILPCDDLIGNSSLKKSVLLMDKEGAVDQQKLFLHDDLCDDDRILDLIQVGNFYYLLYQENIKEQLVLEILTEELEIVQQTIINAPTNWSYLDPSHQQILVLSADTLTTYDFLGQEKTKVNLNLNLSPTKVQFAANANFNAFLFSGNSHSTQEKASALLVLNKAGDLLESVMFPQVDFCDLAITESDRILVLSDRSQGDFYDSIPQPLRVTLFDSQLRMLAYKDHGIPFVHPSSISLTSDRGYCITGTRLKSIDLINGQAPNQLFFKKEHLADLTLDNKELNGELSIKLYPNPTNASVLVDLGSTEVSDFVYRIEILSINGEVLQGIDNCSKSQLLSLDSLPAGYYWVRMTNQENGMAYIKPLIKQ